jgi:hypothetical protein
MLTAIQLSGASSVEKQVIEEGSRRDAQKGMEELPTKVRAH